MNALPANWRGRRVTVMGLGLSGGGVEVTRYLAGQGAQVTVTDERPAALLQESLAALAEVPFAAVLGEHRREDFERCELVIANPAVSPQHALLEVARSAGARISSEIELFLDACPAPIAAVTGTQGKSSTANATHQLLRASGLGSTLGGNIGRSLLGELDSLDARGVVVLELSSYQLESLAGRAPLPQLRAAAVVNVLEDHIERHGSVQAYERAKQRLADLLALDGSLLLNADDPRVERWTPARERVIWSSASGAVPRARLRIEDSRFRFDDEDLGDPDAVRLPGSFQRANVLLALGLARCMGAAPAALRASIGALRGLEHRLQDLGRFGGHRVWDNGVSTTPDSTLVALQELSGRVCLLAGGQAKQLALDAWIDVVRRREARVIFFGRSARDLASAFARQGVVSTAFAALPDAVQHAFQVMQPDEELLFSPACASFDAYRNFRDRALEFRREIARWPRQGEP